MPIALIDNRGFVPGSLEEKTEAAIDGLEWVKVAFEGAYAEGLDYGIEALAELDTGDAPGCSIARGDFVAGTYKKTPDDSLLTPANQIWSGLDITLGYLSGAFHISGSVFGTPGFMQRMPDGCTIEAAQMEIVADDLTRTFNSQVGGVLQPTVTTLENIHFAVVALNRSAGFEVVYSFPATTADETVVVTATDAIQAIYDRRSDGTTVAYGIVAAGKELAGANLDEILDSLLAPIPTRVYDEGTASCQVTDWEQVIVTWGNLGFGTVKIRVTYPEGDARDIVVPRWPVLD
jgi:hypothetical protein